VAGEVQAFIDRHWSAVLARIGDWQTNKAERAAMLRFVRTVRDEWSTIPLQEKETPDVPLERNFWAALSGLEICAQGREGIEVRGPDGKFPDNFEDWLTDSLEKTYNCMRDRKPLVEGCFVGRRPIP
jgi:hypothetical protein